MRIGNGQAINLYPKIREAFYCRCPDVRKLYIRALNNLGQVFFRRSAQETFCEHKLQHYQQDYPKHYDAYTQHLQYLERLFQYFLVVNVHKSAVYFILNGWSS